MGTARKQKQIREILSKLQLSIPNFAGLVYEELYVDGDDTFGVSDADEERKFAEKIKKQLSRATTSEKTLDQYLEILAQQPGFEALGYVKSRYVPHACLSEEMTEAMSLLSAELDAQTKQA